jgi:hypothetical protein
MDHHSSGIQHQTPLKAAPNHQYKITSRWKKSVIRGTELQHGLAVAGPQKLARQRQDARRLPGPCRPLRIGSYP